MIFLENQVNTQSGTSGQKMDNEQQQMMVHPIYLLQQQISNKALKKKSLQQIGTISLCLGKDKTRSQLLPYLINLFNEQQSTQFKIITLQSIKRLIDPKYIKKSGGILIFGFIIDVLCVYAISNKDKQIKDVSYQCLNNLFLLINLSKAQNVIINAIKNLQSLANSQNQNTNSKENISVGNIANINQVILALISYIYPLENIENNETLSSILRSYYENQSKTKQNLKLLSIVLERITINILQKQESELKQQYLQEIYTIIERLIQTKDSTIQKNIQPTLIKLQMHEKQKQKQKQNPMKCSEFLEAILHDEETQSNVICSYIKNINNLIKVFSIESLKPIQKRIQQYDQQPQEIKNSILEIIDKMQPIAITEQNKLKILCPQKLPSSLQLRTTLLQSLCRVSSPTKNQDTSAQQYAETLNKLLNSDQLSKDINFLIKIYQKLPPFKITRNPTLHLLLISKVMSNRSWRQKLTLLQLLQNNFNNDKLEVDAKENVCLLLEQIFKYIGDKIACIRVSVTILIAKIYNCCPMVCLSETRKIWSKFIYEKRPSWFERQSFHIIFDNLINLKKTFSKQDYEITKQICQIGLKDKIVNIKSIAASNYENLQKYMNN